MIIVLNRGNELPFFVFDSQIGDVARNPHRQKINSRHGGGVLVADIVATTCTHGAIWSGKIMAFAAPCHSVQLGVEASLGL